MFVYVRLCPFMSKNVPSSFPLHLTFKANIFVSVNPLQQAHTFTFAFFSPELFILFSPLSLCTKCLPCIKKGEEIFSPNAKLEMSLEGHVWAHEYFMTHFRIFASVFFWQ
jgi:hypothetical protein